MLVLRQAQDRLRTGSGQAQGRLRAGLKLIVSHGELVEPRLVASVPRWRGQGVVAAAILTLIWK
ncbi:MAG: hypothetical protein HGA29_07300 [Syntrophaceae bacterium]|nr:hypothetical protein [Syntrophaceae bacterium]